MNRVPQALDRGAVDGEAEVKVTPSFLCPPACLCGCPSGCGNGSPRDSSQDVPLELREVWLWVLLYLWVGVLIVDLIAHADELLNSPWSVQVMRPKGTRKASLSRRRDELRTSA